MRRVLVVLLIATSLAPAVAQRHTGRTSAEIPVDQADNWYLSFAGSARKPVKLRTESDGASYNNLNNGSPMSIVEWLSTAYFYNIVPFNGLC
jgi:hypothetical protein